MSLIDKVNRNLKNLLGRTPTPEEVQEYVNGAGLLMVDEQEDESKEIKDPDQIRGAV